MEDKRMVEFKTVEQGTHKGRGWKVLQAVKHTMKQLENDFFFQWEDEEARWIPNIEAREIGIQLGTFPPECAKYFLTE